MGIMQKNRPRYSQSGAIYTGTSRYQPIGRSPRGESGGILTEGIKFFLGALRAGGQGETEIQAEHFHEALAVDPVPGIPDGNGKRFGGSQGYKLLHILYTCQLNLKFHSKVPPRKICTNIRK